MKQLQNKETQIDGSFDNLDNPKETEARKATYADLLRIAMMGVTQENSIANQRKDFRVIDVLEKAIKEKTETMEFEDADFVHMKDRVSNTKWGFKHRGLFQLEDDLEEASKKKKEE